VEKRDSPRDHSMAGASASGNRKRCGARWWKEGGWHSRPQPRLCWSWCCTAGSGCGSEPGWTRRPCARCGRQCAQDAPAGHRAGVPVRDARCQAPELGRAACAGAGAPGSGCLGRACVRLRQPPAGSPQNSVWGAGRMPWATTAAERRQEITAQELGAVLSEMDLAQATRRKRYRGRGLEYFAVLIFFPGHRVSKWLPLYSNPA